MCVCVYVYWCKTLSSTKENQSRSKGEVNRPMRFLQCGLSCRRSLSSYSYVEGAVNIHAGWVIECRINLPHIFSGFKAGYQLI